MKKLYAGLALAAALLAGTATTYAQDPTLNNETVVSGTPFTLEANEYAVFIPQTSGILELKVAGEVSYTDHLFSAVPENGMFGYTPEIEPYSNTGGEDSYTYYYAGIEAGKNYYIFYGASYEKGITSFTATMQEPPTVGITSMTPAAGNYEGLGTNGVLTVTFEEAMTQVNVTVVDLSTDTALAINHSPMKNQEDYEYGEDTTWSYTCDYDSENAVIFYEGTQYQAIFQATLTSGITIDIEGGIWVGTTPPNAADAPEFLGVSPENGATIENGPLNIEVSFDAPVTLTAGFSAGQGSVTSLSCESDDNMNWVIILTGNEAPFKESQQVDQIMISATATYGDDDTVLKFYDEELGTWMNYLSLTYKIFGNKTYGTRAITVREIVASGEIPEITGTESAPTQVTGPINGFNIYSTNPVIANYAEITGAYANIAVYNQAGALVTKIDTDVVYNDENQQTSGSGYDFMLQEPVSADGIYKLIIPELAFNVSPDQGATYYNEETVVWFQIGTETMDIPECPEATPNKANNSEVTSLSNLTISWGAPLSNINTSLISVNKVIGTASEPVEFSAYISNAIEEDDDDVLVIQVDNVIGNVEVNIGASAVNILVDGVLIGNDPVTLSYVVVEPDYTALPANVTELMGDEGEVIGWKLTWEGISQCYYSEEAGPLTATNEDTNESYTILQGNEIVAIGGELTIDLSNLPGGNYTVLLPEGYLILGENYVNASEELKVKTTAVSSLVADKYLDGAVYNLQGMKVNANNLKPGIYVINGKKVLVK